MVTLDKFLIVTLFNRGDNYPTRKELDKQIKINKCTIDLKIEVYTYFLYDDETI